jgi:hypothetical protein
MTSIGPNVSCVFLTPGGDGMSRLDYVNLVAGCASQPIYPTAVKHGKVGSAKLTKDGVGRSECYL